MISASELPLVTMARSLNCWPFPACLINSLAARRPIRPKPYNTTSLGSILSCSALRLDIKGDGDIQNHDNSYGAISDERI